MRDIGDLFTQYEEIAREQDRKKFRYENGIEKDNLSQMYTLIDGLRESQNCDIKEIRDRVDMHWELASSKASKRHGHDTRIGTFKSELDKADRAMESPIERILLPWLVKAYYGPMFIGDVPVFVPTKGITHLPDGNIFIICQMPIGSYRTDFLLVAKHKGQIKQLAIECDGNSFHNNTTDRLRDGFLACIGIQTVRATGSEIKNSADNVANRVSQIIFEWAIQL